MKIKSVNLETVCGITSVLPENTHPEIVFTGKSNVGKSSLINSLMNRKNYAHTSGQPGKTQTINYYNINDELYLVDLPGYGYAKISQKERDAWGEMVERYLTGSEMLAVAFLLIDIRHDPTEQDKQMFDWLTYLGIETIVIATKSDKLNRSQVNGAVKNIQERLNADEEQIIVPYSSVTMAGREEVWDFMDQVIENFDPEDWEEDEEDE